MNELPMNIYIKTLLHSALVQLHCLFSHRTKEMSTVHELKWPRSSLHGSRWLITEYNNPSVYFETSTGGTTDGNVPTQGRHYFPINKAAALKLA